MIRSLSITFLFITHLIIGQGIPVGTWRTHLSFNQIVDVTISGTRVYAATRSGIFYVDEDQSINIITKLDGLNDQSITSLAADNIQTLMVGYSNGNLDILAGNQIFNVDAIKNTTLSEDKTINHILIEGQLAYLSTDFGVVVYNLQEMEIEESYLNLDEDGSLLKINEGSILDNRLYLATESGVISGDLGGSVNLQDFNNWDRFTGTDGIPQTPVSSIAAMGSSIMAGIPGDGLYLFNGAGWQRQGVLENELQYKIFADDSQWIITTEDQVWTLLNVVLSLNSETITAPVTALSDSQNRIWIGDNQNGLIKSENGNFETIIPSGPASNFNFKLLAFNNKILETGGGYSQPGLPNGNQFGFYLFENDRWKNYNNLGIPGSHLIPVMTDFVDAAYAAHRSKIYLASYGDGILEWDGISTFNTFDETNSPLIPDANGDLTISSVFYDFENLWVSHYGSPVPVLRNNSTGNWETFNFLPFEARFILKLTVAPNGDVWARIDPAVRNALLIFNPVSEEVKFLDSSNGLTPERINDFTLDKNNQVWIGTDDGVWIVPNASSVLINDLEAITPIFENRPLFRNESVKLIEVDGGNRKWIVTAAGLWLFNDSGDELLQNFNQDNSPLLSNIINDLEIDPVSGELFIGTAEGLISYRTGATEGTSTHTNVKIFPNPVTPEFNGQVGITGLVGDAIVKITDLSGKLVFQTRAQGSTATWNVKDHHGRRAASGMYLVFSSSEDGLETFVGKIAVVN